MPETPSVNQEVQTKRGCKILFEEVIILLSGQVMVTEQLFKGWIINTSVSFLHLSSLFLGQQSSCSQNALGERNAELHGNQKLNEMQSNPQSSCHYNLAIVPPQADLVYFKMQNIQLTDLALRQISIMQRR